MSPKNNLPTLHVFLGRFSPMHLGHQRTIDMLISKFGKENLLIIVGSSTSLNSRTPFSYQARKRFIGTVYPDLKVLPLPDANPELVHFDGSTNSLWLDSLQDLETKLASHFIFYGGSQEDLAVLSTRFETSILIDRFGEGDSLSATQVREALDSGDTATLHGLLDPKILPLVVSAYQEFRPTS